MDPSELGLRRSRPLALVGCLPPPPRLAIVGSRAAWRDRSEAVASLVAIAKRRGHSVVSGGALGIDAAAHEAALAAGVPQVAVLPCGCDLPYPPAHEPLFQRIVAQGGGVLFGRPQGAAPSRSVFVSRNAIVVALADRVAVAQLALRSGTMSTARLALRAQVPLAVLGGQAAAAVLARAGAAVLPFPTSATALALATEAWFDGQPLSSRDWPDGLQALHAAIVAAGTSGLAIDGLAPGLLVLLAHAEGLGLAGELTPGRYVALQ